MFVEVKYSVASKMMKTQMAVILVLYQTYVFS